MISDNALLMLLKFLKAFLTCIGIPSEMGAELVMSLWNVLGVGQDNFERYVV